MRTASALCALVMASVASAAWGQIAVDFDTDLGGNPLPAGTIITDQLAWMTVSADNFRGPHRDAAIIFDSANPTGGDPDLRTPGYHPTNTAALGNVLILAENLRDRDHNGLVDVPDDEARRPAGWIQFDLALPATSAEIVLIDMEEPGGLIEISLGASPVGSMDIPALGDNSVQTLSLAAGPDGTAFDRIRVSLPGSGAIGSVTAVPGPGSVALLMAACTLVIRRRRVVVSGAASSAAVRSAPWSGRPDRPSSS